MNISERNVSANEIITGGPQRERVFVGKNHGEITLYTPEELRRRNRLRVVNFEERKAGYLLGRIRRMHHVTTGTIGMMVGKTPQEVSDFENGNGGITIRRLYKAADLYVDSEDESMKEIWQLIEDKKWLRTILTQKPFKMNEIVRKMRLSVQMPQAEFGRKTIAGLDNIPAYESDNFNGKMELYTLNQFIEVSTLSQKSKAAQLLRLRTYDMLPMTMDELQICDLGRFLTYLRVVNGFSQKDLAEEMGFSAGKVEKLELGELRLMPSDIKAYLKMAGLYENGFIADILKQKNPNKKKTNPLIPIAEEVLQGALGEQILFQEHVDKEKIKISNARSYVVSQEYKDCQNVGEIFTLLAKGKWTTSMRQIIWNWRTGKRQPYDYKVAEYALYLDYDIHHPLTDYLLKRLKQEKADFFNTQVMT